jgi:ribosomal protein S18 acetylase RimI-like enzyme
MITVRKFEDGDAARASEILRAAFRSFLGEKYSDSGYFSPEELVKRARLEDKFSVTAVFVAEEDGRLAGVISVCAGANGLGSLENIGVDPNCHSRGIGGLLMAKAEEFWTERKQRKIGTCVSAHNKKALMYYLKHDFIPEGYRRDHFIPGVDEIILGRFLRNSP